MADRGTKGEHIDLGTSSTVVRPVACEIGNVCVDIAILQSSHDKEGVKDFVAEYGQVIVDECHHLSAFTFEQVMKQVKAKYIVGLTATPERKDGHHPIIY